MELEYKKGRCIIGNPPFGSRNTLSVKFYKKAIRECDYIAFIQPISQLENNQQLYEFDLIHSEDLGKKDYSGVNLHCCFNIYKRPKNGLNKRNNYNLKEVKLVQDRGKNGFKNEDYDFRICIWGAECGKILEKEKKYAKETAFYIEDKNKVEKIKSLFGKEKIKDYFNFISTPYLPNSSIYKYLKEQIPELN